MATFTERDAKFMAAAFQSLRSPPDIDYGKIATILGMTKGSVANVMGPLKKKVFGASAGAAPAVRSPATPNRTPRVGRGTTNRTPRSTNAFRSTGTDLDDLFSTPNVECAGSVNGSPTPTPAARRTVTPGNAHRVATPKRKAGELEDSDDEIASPAPRAQRQRRAASLIQREPVRADTDADENNTATTDSIANSEYSEESI